ncbi:MAG: branched-chain amino acid ABC transporter permease [Burkholderiales bacterium]
MDDFLVSLVSILFHGVAYGMVLYVISVGLSITMGLMGFANLAHGVFAMAGGYVMISAMSMLGAPYPVALLIAFLVIALISLVLELTLYSRLYTASELDQVLFTIGLIFISVALARLAYGTLQQPVLLPEYLKGQFSLLGRDFPTFRVFLIAVSSIIVAGLWVGVERTSWGAMLRAAVDNRAMAQSVGINTRKLFMITFAAGSGLAGFGGALGAEIIAIQPIYPFANLAYFLIVVAAGGMGTLRGPFVAALLIGITDTACKYWLPEFGAFLIYATTIGILLWRPAGLFGRNA